jgi:hypothetical protein
MAPPGNRLSGAGAVRRRIAECAESDTSARESMALSPAACRATVGSYTAASALNRALLDPTFVGASPDLRATALRLIARCAPHHRLPVPVEESGMQESCPARALPGTVWPSHTTFEEVVRVIHS